MGRRRSGHDAYQRLADHSAVTDETRIGFLIEHLRRGAGRDQRMETRDGATGDGDEQEREQLALNVGPPP